MCTTYCYFSTCRRRTSPSKIKRLETHDLLWVLVQYLRAGKTRSEKYIALPRFKPANKYTSETLPLASNCLVYTPPARRYLRSMSDNGFLLLLYDLLQTQRGKKYIRRLLSSGMLQRVFCQGCTDFSEDLDVCVIRVDELQRWQS
jgi:hypothetical protein